MRHRQTVLGDSRENEVPCAACVTMTWNVCGACDDHCTHSVDGRGQATGWEDGTGYALTESGRMLLSVKRGSWS